MGGTQSSPNRNQTCAKISNVNQARIAYACAWSPLARSQCDLTTAGDEWGSKFVSFRFNMRMQQGLIDDINA